MSGKSAITWSAGREENDAMNKAKERVVKMPKFMNEDEEAKWWASAYGRAFLKQQSAARTSKKQKGSSLVSNLSRAASVQIALRLPAPDLAEARKIAGRKGIGYQTLLKIIVHEGLQREARRQ
jgi:predicted DNA binding CopG/RHH family protein